MRAIKIILLLGIIVWAGCASSSVTTLRDDTFKSSMITSLASMPFIMARLCVDGSSGENALFDCRFSAIKASPEFYSPDATWEISSVLHEELHKKYGSVLKDYNTSVSVFKELTLTQQNRTLRALATTFAREFDAEYVVIGVLDSYIDRKGSASGIDSPASVSFSIYLVHTATGSVVFEGSFNETQQALSENVLHAPTFFKRGAHWLTAKELSRDGIIDILAEIQ